VGKKRLRVEALLAAAASPVPPPAACLVPDPTLAADLFPQDLPHLLGLLGRADLYLQDEVEVALHPTLTRVWSRAVTHTHRRQSLADLVADADQWAHTITPAQVLSQIGSPFAPDQRPILSEELNHAA
jgi:hypothetical protein